MSAKLLGLEQLGFRGQSVVYPRLNCQVYILRGFQRTLTNEDFLSGDAKLIETLRYLKNDFLMSCVKPDVRHH